MTDLPYKKVPYQLECKGKPFPCALVNDDFIGSMDQLVLWLQANQETLEHDLQASGVLLFRGFPVDAVAAFKRFYGAFGASLFVEQTDATDAAKAGVLAVEEIPAKDAGYLHHERAKASSYPSKLFFYCEHAPEKGGAMGLCRSDMLYASLEEAEPAFVQELAKKGLRYKEIFPEKAEGVVGEKQTWQVAWAVTERAEAEQKLASLGYTWTWREDGALCTSSPVLPALKILDDENKVFFNDLLAVALQQKGAQEEVLQTVSFGDDSSIPSDIFAKIAGMAEPWTFTLRWQDGDIVLVDNLLVMHAHQPEDGTLSRKVFVAMTAD
ncbi:MAG: TauD/TfdA family dioxygenase [Myxococcales bacterium]|nr:TauD/TfdA family dioxygenase [Myxococcales bacterium]